MSSSITGDLQKEIKKAFGNYTDKFGSKFSSILNSIFKSFMSNDPEYSQKIEKYLEDADDEISEQLNSFYNTILKLVTFVYKERFTSDQLESELAEIGKS